MSRERALRPLVVAAAIGGLVAAVIAPGTTPDYSPPTGALNPAVTQSTIHTTVCVHGWTATIRPSSRYTSPIERQMIEARHLPGTADDYELDHFIPLGIGGAPRDPANLWPQRWPQAHAKDFAEVRLLHALCAGTITLADARIQIADPVNWHKPAVKP